MTFEIKCKELTPERRQALAPHEVAVIGRPIRLVLAAGGAYIFYYGTNGEAPPGFQSAAVAFSFVGIAAVLVAIFIQKLVDIRYFAKALKEGCFPAGVSVGEGGVYIRRADRAGTAGEGKAGAYVAEGAEGVESVNAVRFYAFAEIGRIEEYGEESRGYFKMSLPGGGGAPGVFLFKEDFVNGDAEAFMTFIDSKRPG